MGINLPDLRQLRQFVAVAERLHFGRAAEAIRMAQPPLSRSIRDLEQRLGVTLLARTRRRVELTAEGAYFLNEARRILKQLDEAAAEVGRMAQGTAGRIRLGFIPLADYGVLPDLLQRFKAAHPGVTLSLREMFSPEQETALEAGELDFAVLVQPRQRTGFEHIVLQREPFMAALPRRHRLAKARGRLHMRQLADEPFVVVPREFAPALNDVIMALTGSAGYAPRVAQEAIETQTVVSLVSSGLGVALVPQSVAAVGRKGVAFRAIADPHPPLEIQLTWRRGFASTAGKAFIAAARAVAR